MQAVGPDRAMKAVIQKYMMPLVIPSLLTGCVTHVYQPGKPENPLHKLQLGQTYGDMVKTLGEADHGVTEDRMGIETLLLFIPVWGLVEWIGDFNPSMMQGPMLNSKFYIALYGQISSC